MWSYEEGNNNIHLANWPSICMKKEFGGLGIPNLFHWYLGQERHPRRGYSPEKR
jgi:hypothetical protein